MSQDLQVSIENENVELAESTSVISSELAKTVLENLNKLKQSKGTVTLDAKYQEFSKTGETVEGIYMGLVPAKFKVQNFDAKNPQYNVQDAVKWVQETNGNVETKICASVALVNKFKQNNVPVGAGVKITYTGKDGNVKLFDVAIIAL